MRYGGYSICIPKMSLVDIARVSSDKLEGGKWGNLAVRHYCSAGLRFAQLGGFFKRFATLRQAQGRLRKKRYTEKRFENIGGFFWFVFWGFFFTFHSILLLWKYRSETGCPLCGQMNNVYCLMYNGGNSLRLRRFYWNLNLWSAIKICRISLRSNLGVCQLGCKKGRLIKWAGLQHAILPKPPEKTRRVFS